MVSVISNPRGPGRTYSHDAYIGPPILYICRDKTRQTYLTLTNRMVSSPNCITQYALVTLYNVIACLKAAN